MNFFSTFLTLILIGGNLVLGQNNVTDYKIIQGENTLESRYEGEVIFTSGESTLLQSSEITGNVYIVSTDLIVQGSIQSDIYLVSGTLNIEQEAEIAGTINVLGGQVILSEKAKQKEYDINYTYLQNSLSNNQQFSSILIRFSLEVLFLGIYSLILMNFFKNNIRVVKRAINEKPFYNLALGFTVLLVLLSVLSILFVTGILIPIAFVWLVLTTLTYFSAQVIIVDILSSFLKKKINSYNLSRIIGIIVTVLLGTILFSNLYTGLIYFFIFLLIGGAMIRTKFGITKV